MTRDDSQDHSWLVKGATAWYGKKKLIVQSEPYMFNGKLVVTARYDERREKQGGIFEVSSLHSVPRNF